LQFVELRNAHRDVSPQLQALISHFAQGELFNQFETLQVLVVIFVFCISTIIQRWKGFSVD
jgi:hypothetical protein